MTTYLQTLWPFNSSSKADKNELGIILENNGSNIDESVYSKSLDIKSPNDKTKTLLPDIYTPTKTTTTTTTTTSYSPPNNSSQSPKRHEESPFSKFKIWGQKN